MARVKPRPGSPEYFIWLMENVGCTPEDVVGTLARNLTAKKTYHDNDGNPYEVDDGPTQVSAANIMLKGMRVLSGSEVNVFNQSEGGAPLIQFGGPSLSAPPPPDSGVIEGKVVRAEST